MISLPNFLIPSLIPVIIFIVFLQKWLSRTSSTTQQRLPPSPRKLPLIGNLHQLGALPHRSLHSLSKHYNGGLMILHLGNVPLLVASSSDAAREILKNQDSIFASRPKLNIPYKLFYGSRDLGFSPYGEYWRQMRCICMLQLLSKKRVQSFRSVREEEMSLMVERIRHSVSSSSVVNLSDVLASLNNDIICRVALGRKYSNEGKMFNKLVREFMESLGASSIRDYIPWLGWIDRFSGLDSKAERVFKGFDEFLNGVIEEHRRNRSQGGGEQLDFVGILLLDLQTDKKENSLLEHDSIKALILDMFAAGSETSYTVLVWTMAELVRNPKKMKLLQSEVREISGNKDAAITEDDLHQMHYLRAVIKESLRLHPAAPLLIPRESTEHTNVLGYDIPKGTLVMVNAWAIGRDPLAWENPETFYPERFLGRDTDYKGRHFEFIPFGSGRRMCPGMTFAEHVVELALATLVNEFDFSMPNGESVDMSEGNGITVHKRLPLVLVATPRKL